jgi:hypothetical protein
MLTGLKIMHLRSENAGGAVSKWAAAGRVGSPEGVKTRWPRLDS